LIACHWRYSLLLRTEAVRAEALDLEARGDLAGLPLAGVPVAINDNLDLAGVPTRNGSAATSEEPAAAQPGRLPGGQLETLRPWPRHAPLEPAPVPGQRS
jgi:hypothetical protein